MLDRMEAEEGAGGRAQRGDVWQVDMGIAGKVRPCLLLTDYPADDELAMP
jgi:mRNA-degrading endonuclease toxin of MazEF toxin-antitoxin module